MSNGRRGTIQAQEPRIRHMVFTNDFEALAAFLDEDERHLNGTFDAGCHSSHSQQRHTLLTFCAENYENHASWSERTVEPRVLETCACAMVQYLLNCGANVDVDGNSTAAAFQVSRVLYLSEGCAGGRGGCECETCIQ